jgi:hypothetical protein
MILQTSSQNAHLPAYGPRVVAGQTPSNYVHLPVCGPKVPAGASNPSLELVLSCLCSRARARALVLVPSCSCSRARAAAGEQLGGSSQKEQIAQSVSAWLWKHDALNPARARRGIGLSARARRRQIHPARIELATFSVLIPAELWQFDGRLKQRICFCIPPAVPKKQLV